MDDLQAVRELAAAATAALEASRRRIDDLNVYPVPDGDTGTNLVLTARVVAETVDALDESDREPIARELTANSSRSYPSLSCEPAEMRR